MSFSLIKNLTYFFLYSAVSKSYDGNTLTHVINAAGPNQVYFRPGYATQLLDNGRPISASYKINQDCRLIPDKIISFGILKKPN